ncbi:efflux RND transporter permease subunit [Janthinobacterium sp. PAMC25594]|uniref:efflux RND transporter permease subunit n=1 Tax=Janthinobacterium sp. PAMC25594 TaxID=2861284 RepID=UPI001C624EF1|nr:efflux RND transporter permease subunit [Janthinobacterium sp. PAMC25594]QYG08896.1 efflux RND transporter permease subunit [Janthinobacterium sp. PAMC25594]
MKMVEFCLRRPIAVLLFWISVIAAGLACWLQLPLSALPTYDTPTIQVGASLSGASPETMSTSVATPLEKQFTAIPDLLTTTSTSIQGESKITLEFDPGRNIDAAAGDVQAALYRATRSLPAEMTTPPSYRKVNPSDMPVLLIGLSSPSLKLTDLNGFSDKLIVPALSTLSGVAQVNISGRKRYAVRIEVDPDRLAALDLTLAEVSIALKAANSNAPLGQFDSRRQMMTLQLPPGLMKADDFSKLVIASRNGQQVRLSDFATVLDSIENTQDTSSVNGASAILLQVMRQPGANTVATVEAIRAMLPKLAAQMPASVQIRLLNDRSISIRQAIHDVNLTMLLTIALVVMVIMLFLRHAAATVIPSISLPVSLLGTFALMAACGMSLNNISLMGLTIAVGLMVDDAIVVLENIMRYIEEGLTPYQAALRGTAEVAFTVVSISVSLVAVFIPIFFMPGTLGLLFHEFAIVVTLAILVSAAAALTLIPVLVPMLVKPDRQAGAVTPAWSRWFESAFEWTLQRYASALDWAIGHRPLVLGAALATLALTAALYVTAPKGFFPQEDTGQISANVDTPQDMSYLGRLAVLKQLEAVLLQDPYVSDVASKVDHDTTSFYITLKAASVRPAMPAVLAKLRAETAFLPNIQVFFSPVQSLKVGGRSSKSTYQYTLQSVSPGDLDMWSEKLLVELKKSPLFVGVNSDSQRNGLDARLAVDRDRAALLGIDMASMRNTLYAAYGTRQVSTIYAPEDSYQVIMELGDEFRRDEAALAKIQVRGDGGALVPLAAFTSVDRGKGTMAVNHQGQLPAVTLSFDLAPGAALSDADAALKIARQNIGLPDAIFGAWAGQAALFQQSQSAQLWLIGTAVAVIYVILGMLYESWIHPVTILLGVPSAAVGALLALRLTGLELSFIAIIGILLLVGIVKKNAIMIIDFALAAQRGQGMAPQEAVRRACLQRFRPIMMTTLCAIMGALPLALGLGSGAELRQPLGVAIVGGLLLSQLMTLLITPVLYLFFDRLGDRTPALPSAVSLS